MPDREYVNVVLRHTVGNHERSLANYKLARAGNAPRPPSIREVRE